MEYFSRLLKSHQGRIEEARSIRDTYLTCFEKIFMFLNILLLLFGFVMVLTGSAFVVHDLWNDSQFLLGKVQSMATFLVVSYCFLVPFFGCAGLIIVNRRSCSSGCIAIYGTLTFFVIACPLMGEGTAIL